MNSQLWVCKKKICIQVREYRKRMFFVALSIEYNIFFHKLKAESSLHMCVKFHFTCVERIKICNCFYNSKIVIKNKFFFAKFFYFVWFAQNYRYLSTNYEIFPQLSPTEFYLCILQENDSQIFIWIKNY